MIDRKALRAKHRRTLIFAGTAHETAVCSGCHNWTRYPCDVIRLLDEDEALAKEGA